MDDEAPRYMYYGSKKEDVRGGRSEETVRFTRFRCVNKYILTNIAFFLPSLSLARIQNEIRYFKLVRTVTMFNQWRRGIDRGYQGWTIHDIIFFLWVFKVLFLKGAVHQFSSRVTKIRLKERISGLPRQRGPKWPQRATKAILVQFVEPFFRHWQS